MLRILLLSDIHFIHCEDDENEYRSLETAFIEAMDDIRDDGGVNQILICGDVANRGKAEEYEKRRRSLKIFLNIWIATKDKLSFTSAWQSRY